MSIDPVTPIQQCLNRLQAGDPAACAELLRVSQQRLRVIAHNMFRRFARLRRWEETDDVLQNALARLVRQLRDVPVPTTRDFLAAAATQIRRELLDLTRHYFGPQGEAAHHVTPDQGGPATLEAKPDPRGDPAAVSRWTELHERVQGLPDEEREVFGLLWYLDMTQEEAAGLLGVSVKTIKRRWMKARLLLKGEEQSSDSSGVI